VIALRPGLLRALVAWLAAMLFTAGCSSGTAPSFEATDITGADFGRTLDLTGHDGKPRSLKDFEGRAVVVFFGFAHCPDVCPTTMSRLAGVVKAMGEKGERVQVLMVTVDPERDTADALRPYVTAFHPSFLGLTGTVDQVAAVAKEFRVVAEKQKGASPDTYTVDHSAGIYVFDPKGRLRLFVAGNQPASVLQHDLELLLSGA
jgi:protein SCO1